MHRRFNRPAPASPETRQGAFLILAFFCLAGLLTFVAFSVDVGYLALTKTRMQNAVDAAALASVQEITNAVNDAVGDFRDVTDSALGEARQLASRVAELNGVYVDPQTDVRFGQRVYDPASDRFVIHWDVTPANVVQVTARRDEDDPDNAGGRLKLSFAGVTGNGFARLKASAIAYLEPRDLVVVHDLSRSMNFDSCFTDEAAVQPDDGLILQNLQTVWNDLQPLEAGSMGFQPQYLTVTQVTDGVSTAVTFRGEKVDILTSGILRQATLVYDDGSEQIFNKLDRQSTTLTGSKEIVSVWVTARLAEVGKPDSVTTGGVRVTISGDRTRAELSSGQGLGTLDVTFTDGTSVQVNIGGILKSYTFIGLKPIKTLRVSRVLPSLLVQWVTIPVPEVDSGEVSELVAQRFDDTNENVAVMFGLEQIPYPYPSGSWNGFMNHCRTNPELDRRGYRKMYGGLSLVNYILRQHPGSRQTPDLWRTRHYPFHALKEGHDLFCEFLQDLGFGDRVGVVSFDTFHRVETVLDEPDPEIPHVDISSRPITDDYEAIRNLMWYKQAGHYAPMKDLGGGLKEAVALLDKHRRSGARPTILLMSDGNVDTLGSGEETSLSPDWSWDELLDFDGDGYANYSTDDPYKHRVLALAREAVDRGYTLHTMSVGMNADRQLMQALAHLGNGYWVDIPGGMSVSDMRAEVYDAFHKIASIIPPSKLQANPEDL